MTMTLFPPGRTVAGVLLDFDGTLADTADDLIAPVQAMRGERGLDPLDPALLRPWASMGARGLIGQGLGVTPQDAQFAGLRDDFLARYEAAMVVRTRLFDGMHEVLTALERRGVPWGIVSNKIERYLVPIVDTMGLSARSGAVVGGDTTPRTKPDPAPLLHAARVMGAAPADCVYVGDDLRDIAAGRAAGMRTIAAAWGYLDGGDPHAWGADMIVDTPHGLVAALGIG